MPRRHRKMKGGFWNSSQSTWDSITQGASNLWNQTKKASSDAYGYVTAEPSTSNSYSSSSSSTYNNATYGGKRTRRNKRGGYSANTCMKNLAAHAAPFHGKTAEAHNWVGGRKTRKHRRHRRGHKSRKHH